MTPPPLPRSAPEAQGISSAAILDFVAVAEQNIQSLHSLMLMRHGVVIAEGWWRPYRPEAPHVLFSLSKSFTSTAVGLAIAEGLLSVDDPVLAFFPEKTPAEISPNLAAMQVHHLLSMSTGHHEDTTERIMQAKDPIRAFQHLPVEHAPGTYFVYNSGASFMLAAILQKICGQTLAEYLTPRLFEPLGIENAAWDSHPNGVNFGGWGLNLKTEDIARFGQLYLQKGLWHGRQVVPADWVETATSKQIANDREENPDWRQGYGYQFWRCRPKGMYRGDGAFGQFCVVMPEQDAVLAITAGLMEMQPVLDLVWEKILPAMRAEALPGDQTAAQNLAASLSDLKLIPPKGAAASPEAGRISGQTYHFAPNHLQLDSFQLDFTKNVFSYRLAGDGRRRSLHHLEFGIETWVEGADSLHSTLARPNVAPQKVAASGVWVADDTFRLTLCQYESPFIFTLDFRFSGQQVFLDSQVNVDFGPLDAPQLVGTVSC